VLGHGRSLQHDVLVFSFEHAEDWRMLTVKLHKPQGFGGLWQKKKKLRAESVRLAQRVSQRDSVRAVGAADSEESESESTGPTLSAASWQTHAHPRTYMHTWSVGARRHARVPQGL
jgi:hypothetical protein